MKTKKKNILLAKHEKLVELLEKQYATLATAERDSELLSAYLRMISFIREIPSTKMAVIHALTAQKKRKRPGKTVDPEFSSLSLDQVEEITLDEDTPRKTLEKIAVLRFNIPKGSLPSFKNINLLREKIVTSIRNERTHGTIDTLARHSRT